MHCVGRKRYLRIRIYVHIRAYNTFTPCISVPLVFPWAKYGLLVHHVGRKRWHRQTYIYMFIFVGKLVYVHIRACDIYTCVLRVYFLGSSYGAGVAVEYSG